MLEPINEQEVLNLLTSYANKPVYLHVETTNGAYANHFDERVLTQVPFKKYTSHI